MSATIDSNKLMFTIYGHGNDEEKRKDSGEGASTSEATLPYGAIYAMIDSTGTYLWTSQETGGWLPNSLQKLRVDTLEQVEQTAVPVVTGKNTCIIHPTNVPNDYGVVFQYGDGYIDLYLINIVNDTCYGHTTISSFYYKQYDAILVGDYIYMIAKAFGRTGITTYSLNINTMAFGESAWVANACSGGFIDNNTSYVYSVPVWFSDYKWNRGCGFDMSTQWEVIAPEQGSAGFPYIDQAGLCANGNLYLPTHVSDKWVFGVYSGSGNADFETPRPIRTFGDFGSTLGVGLSSPAYSEGRERASFNLNSKTYMTNFSNVQVVSDGEWYPIAMNNHYLVANNFYNTVTKVFKYR